MVKTQKKRRAKATAQALRKTGFNRREENQLAFPLQHVLVRGTSQTVDSALVSTFELGFLLGHVTTKFQLTLTAVVCPATTPGPTQLLLPNISSQAAVSVDRPVGNWYEW
jgi:hypothetical protein